jgi:hypothetical protein
VVASEEPGVQCRSHTPNVQKACGAGCETCADGQSEKSLRSAAMRQRTLADYGLLVD